LAVFRVGENEFEVIAIGVGLHVPVRGVRGL
jgi:hypothetical protein